MRPLLPIAVALGLLLLVVGLPDPALGLPAVSGPQASHVPPPPLAGLAIDGRECKPRGPVGLDVTASGHPGGLLELDFDIRPLRELEQLSWHLQLPTGALRVGGTVSGSASCRAGERTAGTATIRIPASSLAGGELSLVAQGVFRARDGAPPETIEVRRTVRWGAPAALGIATFTERAASGARQSTAPVPVAHRPGS